MAVCGAITVSFGVIIPIWINSLYSYFCTRTAMRVCKCNMQVFESIFQSVHDGFLYSQEYSKVYFRLLETIRVTPKILYPVGGWISLRSRELSCKRVKQACLFSNECSRNRLVAFEAKRRKKVDKVKSLLTAGAYNDVTYLSKTKRLMK